MAPSPSQPTQAAPGPHMLIYLHCRSEYLPPPREMGADEIYACMSGNSFFGEKEHAIHLREKSASRSRLMSQTTQHHQSTEGRLNR